MRHRSFSFADLFCVLGCLVAFGSIGVVKIQRHREAARSKTCGDNFRQLALGLHNYHSAYKRLPAGCGGTSAGASGRAHQSNANRLSAWVGLLPFVEEQALWERIANPYRSGSSTFPAMGPVPWYDPKAYDPWAMRPSSYVCPTDKDAPAHPTVGSYVMNYGDAVQLVGFPIDQSDAKLRMNFRATNRGAFSSIQLRFRDYLDGTANTLFFSEKTIGSRVAKEVDNLDYIPANAIAAAKDGSTKYWEAGRNACWADGTLRSTGFQTILPPNSPSATSKRNGLEGIISANSHHVGGVHVAFADGSVQFAMDSIDSGDAKSPTVAHSPDAGKKFGLPGSMSPYGVWGAIGTRAARERFDRAGTAEITDPPRELTALQKKELLAKPLEVWTARDGKRKLSARQIDIHSGSKLVVMTKDGDVRQIPLSQLASEDAYRAVEKHFAQKAAAQTSLKTHLEEGVKLLDAKRYDEFAKRFIPGGNLDPDGMGKLVAMERGLLLYRMETSLRALSNQRGGAFFSEDKSGDLSVDFAEPRSVFSRLELIYTEGRWQFALPR